VKREMSLGSAGRGGQLIELSQEDMREFTRPNGAPVSGAQAEAGTRISVPLPEYTPLQPPLLLFSKHIYS